MSNNLIDSLLSDQKYVSTFILESKLASPSKCLTQYLKEWIFDIKQYDLNFVISGPGNLIELNK